MQITQITVSAGRTFNHPYESYSNLKPFVTLQATLDPGEDAAVATKVLQGQAEELVEEHKQAMLASIHQLERMTKREQDIARLSRMIAQQQRNLDLLRAEMDSAGRQLPMSALADGEDDEDGHEDAC